MIFNILLLTFSTAIWGFGFVAARWTFGSFDPFWSTALRFLIAGSLSLPFLIYKKSFWRNSLLNLEVLVSILKSPAPRKITYENLAKSSLYHPIGQPAIFEALLKELPTLKTDAYSVNKFLNTHDYPRGVKVGLNSKSKRELIGLSI